MRRALLLSLALSIGLWLTRLDVYISKLYLENFSSLYAVVFTAISWCVLFSRPVYYRLRAKDFHIFLFLFMFFLSVLMVPIYAGDFQNIEQYFSYLVFSLLLVSLSFLANRHYELMSGAVVISGLLLALSVFADAFNIIEFSLKTEGYSRGSGFAENPNFAALALIVALIFSLETERSYYYFASSIFLLAILATGSRYGFIFAILFAFVLVRSLNLSPWRALGLIFVGGLGFYGASELLGSLGETSSMYRRLTFSESVTDITSDSRVSVALDYLSYIAEVPFGRGLNFGLDVPVRAHNTFLNYASDFGIHSALLFSIFYLMLLCKLVKVSLTSGQHWIVVAFIATVPFYNNNILLTKSVLLLIALLIAKSRLKSREFL